MSGIELESEQTNLGVKQPSATPVRHDSNRGRAATLIPAWMLADRPAMGRCDARTASGIGSSEICNLAELVSLWCGFDPESFDTELEFSDAIEKWRRVPAQIVDPAIRTFMTALEVATLALKCGELLSGESLRDPIELTMITVDRFKTWAEGIKLVRPPDPREAPPNAWGRYTNRQLELLEIVLNRHYRLKSDGGNYDPKDRDTRPYPSDIRKTLRQNGCKSLTVGDRIHRLARDPAIPPGRPRKKVRSSRAA